MLLGRRKVLVIGSAALVATGLGIATASTPSSSHVTAPTKTGAVASTDWNGVLPGGANPDSACTGQNAALEDHHTVQVRIPAGLYRTRTVRMEVAMTPGVPVSDDIITVTRKSTDVGSADNYSFAAGEHLFLFDPKPGQYDVAICTFAGAPTPYSASLSLATLSRSADAPPVTPGRAPRYRTFPAPANAERSGEPSIGADWLHQSGQSQPLMYQSGLSTYRVTVVNRHATWTDVSAPNNVASLDPILFTDRYTGRTFTSQLTGQDSLAAYTDDNGATWLPSQGGGMPSGVDHQSMGGGPYPASVDLATPVYGDAVYYCSQDLVTAMCARSDDGGLTFGAGVPIYSTDCAGLHGHVKVAPDGTVYVPNKACNGKQGVVVSTDAGTTWTMRTIPGSSNGTSDPSVAIDAANNVYYSYVDADGRAKVVVSRDRGKHWTRAVNLGATHRVLNGVFPEAVAGSKGRVAVAFLGSKTAGNTQDDSF